MDVVVSGGKGRAVQRRRMRRDGWTKARRQVFLDMLAATCNVRLAAAEAGISARCAYNLRQRDPDFAALWQQAVAMGYERLEQEVLCHALQSVDDITIAHGQVPDENGQVRDPATGRFVAADARLSAESLRMIVALLERNRRIAEGRARPRNLVRRATAEETDAALIKKLDALAKRLGTTA